MEKLLNIKQLSEYLEVSVNTIYSWVSRGKIPFIKLNGIVRFQLDDINTWIDRGKMKVKE